MDGSVLLTKFGGLAEIDESPHGCIIAPALGPSEPADGDVDTFSLLLSNSSFLLHPW